MSVAFMHFTDPYAWLIRGLTEAKWQDITLLSTHVLPKTGAGFDLRHFIRSGGQYGIRLCLMAIDEEGNWYDVDQSYSFEVIFGQNQTGAPSFLVSSKQTGYSSFFPFQPQNPLQCVEQLILLQMARMSTKMDQILLARRKK